MDSYKEKVQVKVDNLESVLSDIAHPENPSDCPITEGAMKELQELREILFETDPPMGECPECGSPSIRMDAERPHQDPSIQDVVCDGCGHKWTEHYLLIGIEER